MNLSSQLIVTETGEVLRNSLVSYNTQTALNEYRPIMQSTHESAHTMFYDGIISPPILSLHQREIKHEKTNYDYCHFIELSASIATGTKPLVIDFDTEDVHEINRILSKNYALFQHIPLIDFILSVSVHPHCLSAHSYQFQQRFLWKRADLIHQKATASMQIAII